MQYFLINLVKYFPFLYLYSKFFFYEDIQEQGIIVRQRILFMVQ